MKMKKLITIIQLILTLPILPILGAHKTIQQAGQHLVDSAPMIGQRYLEGTQNANWADRASSQQSEVNWKAGVAEAAASGARIKGIQAAGDAAYRDGAKNKGAPVIGDRIVAAKGKYEQNFAPVLSAMNQAADSAAPRTRNVSQNIANRLMPVVTAARRAVGKTT